MEAMELAVIYAAAPAEALKDRLLDATQHGNEFAPMRAKLFGPAHV